MKNTLVDVHNMLVEQLRRLNQMDACSEKAASEIARSEAMVKVAYGIAETDHNMISATKLQYDIGNVAGVDPMLLGDGKADATTV